MIHPSGEDVAVATGVLHHRADKRAPQNIETAALSTKVLPWISSGQGGTVRRHRRT